MNTSGFVAVCFNAASPLLRESAVTPFLSITSRQKVTLTIHAASWPEARGKLSTNYLVHTQDVRWLARWPSMHWLRRQTLCRPCCAIIRSFYRVQSCTHTTLQRARSAGRETEKSRSFTNQGPPSTMPAVGWGSDLSGCFGAGMEVHWPWINK